ncbi:MAG: 2-C-methyl-D-erythritol 4-phosphate cytidylyltransferase [Clostridia bacterium]|nr:2-C-methyl-D-erythritol 4-phosphate cytidylyltransferase [Clostridia bacterium]
MKSTEKIINAIIKTIGKNKKNTFVSAIILAGGKSERMGGISKQLLTVGGTPVVALSALAYENCPDIGEIVVVCREDEMPIIEKLMKEYNIGKFRCAVAGGETRFDSMKNGFERVNVDADYVAVHDAARCLVTPEQISSVISAAMKRGAAIAASKATDTIKIADKNGVITSTVDRSSAWNAQTPQVIKKAMLDVGIYVPRENGFSVTDDAMLVETLGFKVAVFDCGYENIKITTPKDVAVAEAIIEKRRGENE